MAKNCRNCLFKVSELEGEFCFQTVFESKSFDQPAESRKLEFFPEVPGWCEGGIWMEDDAAGLPMKGKGSASLDAV
jgi:hypothetical protein